MKNRAHHHQRRVGHRQMRGYHRGIILISIKQSGSRYRPLGIRSLIVWRERLPRAGISFGRAVAQPSFPVALKYSPSLTASSHSLAVSAPGTSTARWENQLFGAAPCQCFTRRNIHHIAWMQFLRRLAFLLIKAASGNADENLPTAALCVMNMPVVAATRFKSHVINADLRGGQWRQITLPDKVPGKSVVGCADREHPLTAHAWPSHRRQRPPLSKFLSPCGTPPTPWARKSNRIPSHYSFFYIFSSATAAFSLWRPASMIELSAAA